MSLLNSPADTGSAGSRGRYRKCLDLFSSGLWRRADGSLLCYLEDLQESSLSVPLPCPFALPDSNPAVDMCNWCGQSRTSAGRATELAAVLTASSMPGKLTKTRKGFRGRGWRRWAKCQEVQLGCLVFGFYGFFLITSTDLGGFLK